MSESSSFDDLLPLKALIREREALHKEQSYQSSRRIQLLEAEVEKNRILVASYEARELGFRKARDEFRRDVKDLERASMLLQQRENDVEAKNDDLERSSRKYQSNIRGLQDELDAKSSQLSTVMEEFSRYRESVSADMVSRRAFEDLQRDFEIRVPKEAYDRVCVKVGELTRRMDHEFTANENVEELRHKLKRVESSIESHYVSKHVYQRALDDMKAVQASVTVLDEAKELALEAARNSDTRLAATQTDLATAVEKVGELEKDLIEARAEASQYKGALTKATEDIETLNRRVLEGEMNKNMLLTQVGALKATNKKDHEDRAGAEERAAAFQSLCEASQQRIKELEQICADREAVMHQCEEWRVQAETIQTSLETEMAKTRSVMAENEVLASSYLDLSARTSELELRETMLSNMGLRNADTAAADAARNMPSSSAAHSNTAAAGLASGAGSPFSHPSPTPFATEEEMENNQQELERVVRSYTHRRFSPGPPPPPSSYDIEGEG